jgi:hypothetical protein
MLAAGRRPFQAGDGERPPAVRFYAAGLDGVRGLTRPRRQTAQIASSSGYTSGGAMPRQPRYQARFSATVSAM